MTPEFITIASDRLSARIVPHGAELVRLTFDGDHELQWNGDPTVWKGRAPILFPVIGVLNGGGYNYAGTRYAMPKHGFARDMAFAVTSQTPDAVKLRLMATPETRAIYPFEFQLDLHYAVHGPTLTVTAVIANNGDQPMPASFGFHPAFRWPLPFGAPRDAHRIAFENTEPQPIRRIDGQGLLTDDPLPTPVSGKQMVLRDELFTDDAIIFDKLVSRSLRYGAPTGPQLRVDYAGFPVLGLWTKPGAEFICIEPWHGLPDPAVFAGNITAKPGIFLVAPGAARTLAMSVGVEV
jgi:galactose mutarotase-like enzyme